MAAFAKAPKVLKPPVYCIVINIADKGVFFNRLYTENHFFPEPAVPEGGIEKDSVPTADFHKQGFRLGEDVPASLHYAVARKKNSGFE